MDKEEFKLSKKLEDLRHKNRMVEIEAEKNARIEGVKIRFDLDMQLHRLKRADRRHDYNGRG